MIQILFRKSRSLPCLVAYLSIQGDLAEVVRASNVLVGPRNLGTLPHEDLNGILGSSCAYLMITVVYNPFVFLYSVRSQNPQSSDWDSADLLYIPVSKEAVENRECADYRLLYSFFTCFTVFLKLILSRDIFLHVVYIYSVERCSNVCLTDCLPLMLCRFHW